MFSTNESPTKELPKSPYPSWASFTLMNPLRRKFIDRSMLVRDAGVTLGSQVLEIGCGPGFFTEYIAKIAGKDGRVFSQDVEPKMIEKLKRNMETFPLDDNIVPMLSPSTKIDLPDKSMDVIFTANVFEEIEKEGGLQQTLNEASRICKDGGYLFYMEHIYHGVGVPRIENTISLIETSGFQKTSVRKTRFNVYATFRKVS